MTDVLLPTTKCGRFRARAAGAAGSAHRLRARCISASSDDVVAALLAVVCRLRVCWVVRGSVRAASQDEQIKYPGGACVISFVCETFQVNDPMKSQSEVC